MDINHELAQEAINELSTAKHCGDEEIGHLNADEALCELLIKLGYEEVVDEFRAVPKWYA